MINKIKQYLNLRLLIGVLLGAIAGYAYYYFIGCDSGTCSITSDPVNSTLYGVLFGALLFYKKTTIPEDPKNQDQ